MSRIPLIIINDDTISRSFFITINWS